MHLARREMNPNARTRSEKEKLISVSVDCRKIISICYNKNRMYNFEVNSEK